MREDRHGMEVLPLDACFELLATGWLGRVGLTGAGLPLILPVAYALHDDSIVFRSVPGSKLAAIGRGDVVCFEVDHADRDTGDGWSVLVIGRANVVARPELRAELDALDLASWSPHDADHYVRLGADRISGRRIRRPALAAARKLP